MVIENIKLAFNAMRGNKMRTALSLLGIVIGVASVVAILTIGESASQSIKDAIAIGGLDMVTIYPSPGQRNTGIFNEEFSSMLRRDVEGIDVVCPRTLRSPEYGWDRKLPTPQSSGCSPITEMR